MGLSFLYIYPYNILTYIPFLLFREIIAGEMSRYLQKPSILLIFNYIKLKKKIETFQHFTKSSISIFGRVIPSSCSSD